ncbi:hypothetical protein F4782DRAFT_548014 [Xylaria castorea]|nr:hypothetical protein F4782DRAFT_548014 [Xylaria castorea]
MSFNKDPSSSQERLIPRKPVPPATTFDGILTRIDVQPPKPKRQRTLLDMAKTTTRQIVVGPNFDERTNRKSIGDVVFDLFEGRGRKSRAAGKGASSEKGLTEQEAAELDAAEQEAAEEWLRNLRHSVLCQGKSVREDDLLDLSECEGVMLESRLMGKSRANYDDLELVARVAGPMTDGKFKGNYIYLGRNKCMYFSHDIGYYQQIDLEDEGELAPIREIARAYYSLCD